MSGGRFTSFNDPNVISTQTCAINLSGQMVGGYESSDGKTHGFLPGSGTPIDFPDAACTQVNGINDAGEIVGRRDDSAGYTHGFHAMKQ